MIIFTENGNAPADRCRFLIGVPEGRAAGFTINTKKYKLDF